MPWSPSRTSIQSNLVTGSKALATAAINQQRPASRTKADAPAPQYSISQVSKRRCPSHSKDLRYSFGSLRSSLNAYRLTPWSTMSRPIRRKPSNYGLLLCSPIVQQEPDYIRIIHPLTGVATIELIEGKPARFSHPLIGEPRRTLNDFGFPLKVQHGAFHQKPMVVLHSSRL